MNRPSRAMPPQKPLRHLGLFGTTVFWSVVAAVVLGLGYGVVSTMIIHPKIGWIPAAIAAPCVFVVVRASRRWGKMQQERKRESIGTFARALPMRAHDTWVVRAVYEELSRNRGMAIRPGDQLENDLGFSWDELEECFDEIARRTGRSPAADVSNPYYGRVFTVMDVVKYFEHQARLDETHGPAGATNKKKD